MVHSANARPGALMGLLVGLLAGATVSEAGVIQVVSVMTPPSGDFDEVFGATSGDLMTPILAQSGNLIQGSLAVASADQFGSVGIRTAVTLGNRSAQGTVHIDSDEVVNLTSRAQRAIANFVIDGGVLLTIGGRSVHARYELELKAYNLGVADLEPSRSSFGNLANARLQAEFFSTGVLTADATGVLAFSTTGRDIGATFDPLAGRVEIPLSFHSALTIKLLLYNLQIMNELDAAFFALSDPTRRAILARLATGEATVNELVEPFAMTQPAVSRHLKVLEHAGLITRRVEGTTRPCRLDPAGIEALEKWLAMLRAALERNYSRLDEVLAGIQTARPRQKKKERPR